MLRSCPDLSWNTRADIYFCIAQSAYAEKLYPYAYDHLKKAEDAIKQEAAANNKTMSAPRPIHAEDTNLSLMCITTNLGLVYQAMHDYTNARATFNEALTKENGSDDDKGKLYYCIGAIEFEDGSYQQANDYYLQALDLVRDAALKEEINQKLCTVKTILGSRIACAEKEKE
ncbi:unnamed protein product [Rotaria sp. Silwood2]|nr:unnamed protein product [Rotaria sp. Silwood2]CAF2845986.1 unnamed protein product [Rotaria sp. Silwood2]CAF2911825.1 unnamed protein product [Rotaria sp. Silwood2]CAF3245749.1 unnamed protein product [Rotaria sp. Silwood2]CAF4246768.1 unnamed protein product [Rotaria sp. Silwood2]